MPKTEIVTLLNNTLLDTYNGLKTELDSFKGSHGDAPKSSAGDKHETSKAIGLGSLFKANNNWYFIAVAYGKFTTPNFGDVFVISSEAPIARALNGKKIGDTAEFNNISFLISEIK